MCRHTPQATQTVTMTTTWQGEMQVSVRVAPAAPSATTSACVPFYEKIHALFPSLFMYVIVGTSASEIFQIIKQTLMSEMTA